MCQRSLPACVHFTLADGTRLDAAVHPSPRSRHARLSLNDRGQLRLTVPTAASPAAVQASLPEFLPWLECAWAAYQRRAPRAELPVRIVAPLLGRELAVALHPSLHAGLVLAAKPPALCSLLLHTGSVERLLVVEQPQALLLYGCVGSRDHCALALRRWGRVAAERLLPSYLATLAVQGGFTPPAVSIRDQRSRWGSCSQGTGGCSPRVHLNWRALFLPLPLLEHLCWHELCHLRHMNHSPAYYRELARHSPQWARYEKELTAAWRAMPWWELPDG